MAATFDPSSPTTTGLASSPLGGPGGSGSDGDGTEIELFWTRHDPPSEDGESRRLLLVSGLGSPLIGYEEGFVAEFVSRGFSVVRFDNRDVGRSSRIDEDRKADGYRFDQPPYSLVEMAGDATAVMDAVGWDRAHVLGQTMGGMIVQQMAISHPDRLLSMTSLMSSTGNGKFGRATPEAYDALIKPAPQDLDGWVEQTVATGRIWATPDSWDPEMARARARRFFEHGIDIDGTGRQYRAIVASGNRDESLQQISVPTLVLHGTADPLIQPDGGRHTAEVIPDARYVEIEGMGHDLPSSRWAVMADAVASFVADVEAAG